MGASKRSRARPFTLSAVVAMLALGGCELLVGDESRHLRVATDGGDVDSAIIVEAGPDTSARVGSTIEMLATGQGAPRGIAIDDRAVYWANERDGVIMRYDKTSKAAAVFAAPLDGGMPWHLRWVALDATQVFWDTDIGGACLPGILKQSKEGDAGVVAVAGCSDVLDRANGMGVDGTYVYWTTHIAASGLLAAPKEGGNIVTLANNIGGQPDALAVAADAVYWINTQSGTVTRWDKSSTAVRVLVEGQKGLSAIAQANGYVYFANLVDVLRVPTSASADAGTPVETVAPGQNGPAALAVFEDHVYWTNAGDGTVMRAPASGGAAEVVAKQQAGARSIAVDPSGVYFTRDTGEVVHVTFGSQTPIP